MQTTTDLLSLVKNYLKAIEEGKTGDDIAVFYHEDAIQVEYPNTLVTAGATRTVNDIRDASIRGQKVLSAQRFDIQRSFVSGNTVILEMIWTGTLAIPLGKIAVGGEMKAFFAQFIEMKDEKIIHQRTYDCFESFN